MCGNLREFQQLGELQVCSHADLFLQHEGFGVSKNGNK